MIDVQAWWKRTGIDIVSRQRLQGKIIGLINHYKQRARYMGKTTKAELKAQKDFLEEKDNTFWIIDSKEEKRLQEAQLNPKQDQRDLEDWLYLEVCEKNRNATLGSFDTQLAKRKKRSLFDQETLQARREKSSASTSQNVLHIFEE